MRESVPSGVRRSWLRVGFVAAAVAWAAMLPLVPFLASRAHASALATWLVVMVYAMGSMVCHQLPDRSYHLWTAQMPVCARCTGIYLGAAVAAVFANAGHPFRGAAFRGAVPARTALFLAALPAALTLAYEWTTGQAPSNLIRAASGIPIGAVVAWLVVRATRD
jgi:uncharacterized membrane protein